ncbi:MAG TPA: SMI1/KNR4 family protein [Hyphomonadaceae bacterium]|nr:SMI1/KNR4 family protein [Hyphomonadaceae bacterium]
MKPTRFDTRRFDARRFDNAWQRYVAKATDLHPPFEDFLAGGASETDLIEAERIIGIALPDDLRHLLKLHDGSQGYQALPGWELLSSEGIISEWTIWEDLYRSEFKPEGYESEPSGPIRSDEWWRLKWIPFTRDGGGNCLCVDMAPAAGGTKGQVITLWHDNPGRELIAPSLTEFVEILAEDMEDGKLVWDEEWGSFREPLEDGVGGAE